MNGACAASWLGAQGPSCSAQVIELLTAVYHHLLAMDKSNPYALMGVILCYMVVWDLTSSAPLYLMYIGAWDRGQSSNSYCHGARYCKI